MRSLSLFISHSSEVFTDCMPHGDGLVAHAFVTRLAERGHRVQVAAQRVELARPVHGNVTVHLIGTRAPGVLLQRIEYAVRSRRLLGRLRQSRRIDLVHQMNPVFTGLSLGLAGCGLPVVLGAYAARWPEDPDAVAGRGRLTRGLVRYARRAIAGWQQRLAKAILLTTPAAENQLPDAEALRERIHLLPYGTDASQYSPAEGWDSAERLAEEQQHPVILYLASLNERKGVFELLDAFAAVAREFPNCTLRIVGSGPGLAKAREIAAASTASAQIQFLPSVPRSAAVELYRKCAVFCAPSLGEPFGMAVIEAMGCARAVVATEAGGMAHTVRPEGGVLVPMRDRAALAGALSSLLRDPARRLAMGRFNRRWMLEQFSWEVVMPRLEAVYAKVLGE